MKEETQVDYSIVHGQGDYFILFYNLRNYIIKQLLTIEALDMI